MLISVYMNRSTSLEEKSEGGCVIENAGIEVDEGSAFESLEPLLTVNVVTTMLSVVLVLPKL